MSTIYENTPEIIKSNDLIENLTPTASDSSINTSNSHLDTIVYRYPEGTPGADSHNGRYYHDLSPENEDALSQMIEWVYAQHIDMDGLGSFTLHRDLTLLRYLRANNMDVLKAQSHIERNIIYRKQHHFNEIMNSTPDELLGVPLTEVLPYLVHWHRGYDKTGRPVLFKQYAHFDASKLRKVTSFENTLKYHIWEQEAAMQMFVQQSNRNCAIIETMTVIVDVKDMRMSQVTSDFLSIIRMFGDLDASQYPEVLGRLFIINAPMAFPLVWKLIKVWLDPVVASKIFICGGPSDWKPKIFDFIGEENLPSTYGGKMPPLSSDVHPYAQFMASKTGKPLEYYLDGSWKLGK